MTARYYSHLVNGMCTRCENSSKSVACGYIHQLTYSIPDCTGFVIGSSSQVLLRHLQALASNAHQNIVSCRLQLTHVQMWLVLHNGFDSGSVDHVAQISASEARS